MTFQPHYDCILVFHHVTRDARFDRSRCDIFEIDHPAGVPHIDLKDCSHSELLAKLAEFMAPLRKANSKASKYPKAEEAFITLLPTLVAAEFCNISQSNEELLLKTTTAQRSYAEACASPRNPEQIFTKSDHVLLLKPKDHPMEKHQRPFR